MAKKPAKTKKPKARAKKKPAADYTNVVPHPAAPAEPKIVLLEQLQMVDDLDTIFISTIDKQGNHNCVHNHMNTSQVCEHAMMAHNYAQWFGEIEDD